MKRLLLIPILIATCFIGGCGEKYCNHEGSVKAENGKFYTCADRHDGNGLRWYPQ